MNIMHEVCEKKTFRKSIVAVLLVAMMMLITIIPIWAEEIEEVEVIDISPWAVSTLNEAERYGIYPTEWYYNNFRAEISQERLETLMNGTADKIAALGLKEKEKFDLAPYKGDSTRGDIIIRLYNILAKYELPVGESPVEYMQERGILKGTPEGLELDKICTTEDAVVLSSRLIEDTYNFLKAGAKGLAWKVEYRDKVIYFLGSIHVGDSVLYPIDQRLKQAFNESDALIVEANLFDQQGGIEYFIEKATYQDDTTLKDHISQETYEKVSKVFETYSVQEEDYGQFKPWSIANNLTMITATDSEDIQQGVKFANLGIDMYFLSNAVISKKPIYELEGIKYQVDLFDGLSDEFQENYLNSILDSILEPKTIEVSNSSKLLNEWLVQWKNGDIEGFSNSLSEANKETENEFSTMLFGKRDKDMANKIVEILESGEKVHILL